MYIDNKLLIGKSEEKELVILPKRLNRHGLITGATGTGKTVTAKVLIESLSSAGIPSFIADVKGDLAGTCTMGVENENVTKRVESLKLDGFQYSSFPVQFWDLYHEGGLKVRVKVGSIEPDILSMMLGLNEAQEGVLTIIYKISEDLGYELVDLKDLNQMIIYIGEHKNDFINTYGNITSASLGVIQRCLLTLERQGADKFFGEPELNINDFISTNSDGKGMINILHSVKLFESPDLYASFLLWLMTELFTELPEVGDLDKPKIVFFFDEAHLLFNNMPDFRLKQIVQVVKLIRSRGVGIFFISQSPSDIPNEILSQLGNRIQHNLNAYTPSEMKAVKVAASSFRENPHFNTEKEILNLKTGEALISFQNEDGEPNIVEKATILPPQSYMGTIDDATRKQKIESSLLYGKYEETVDRESAYEKIAKIKEEEDKIKAEEEQKKLDEKKKKEDEKLQRENERKKKAEEREKNNRFDKKLTKKVINSAENKVINKALNKIFNKLFK